MLAPSCSNLPLANSSTSSPVGSASPQVSKDFNSGLVPEQNTTEGLQASSVPFQNSGDTFAAMLEKISATSITSAIVTATTTTQPVQGQQSVQSLTAAASNVSLGGQQVTSQPTGVQSQSLPPSSSGPQVQSAVNAALLNLLSQQNSQLASGTAVNQPSAALPLQILTVDSRGLDNPTPTGKKKQAVSGNKTDDPNSNIGLDSSSPSNTNSTPNVGAPIVSNLLAAASTQVNVPTPDNPASAASAPIQTLGQIASPRQVGTSTVLLTDASASQPGVSSASNVGADTKVFSLSLQANSTSQDSFVKPASDLTAKSDSLTTAPLSPQTGNVDPSKQMPANLQNSTNGSVAAARSDDSGVPLRVSPATKSSDSSASGDSDPETMHLSLPAKDDSAGPQKKENGQPDDSLSSGIASLISETKQVGSNFTATNLKETIGSTQSSSVNQSTDLQGMTTSSGSAKELVVRLQGQSGETISVRLTDQGGQVQVAVRSSDASSASALRQDLSSLTSNLDRIGWKADVTRTLDLPNSGMSANDTTQSGGDSKDDSNRGAPEWEQQSRRQRASTPDLWDEVLDRQSN